MALASEGNLSLDNYTVFFFIIYSKKRRARQLTRSMMFNLQKRLEIEEENERHLAIPYLTKVKFTNNHTRDSKGWDTQQMTAQRSPT